MRARVAPALQPALRSIVDRSFLRFLVVGGLNTAVAYGLLWVALAIAPTTFIALCVSTILAILFSFLTNGTLVFSRAGHGSLALRMLKFFSVYGVIFAYNAMGLEALERAGIGPRVGGLLLLPGAVLFSYLLNRRFVFGATP